MILWLIEKRLIIGHEVDSWHQFASCQKIKNIHYISLPLFHSILLNLQHTGISRKTPGTRRIIVQWLATLSEIFVVQSLQILWRQTNLWHHISAKHLLSLLWKSHHPDYNVDFWKHRSTFLHVCKIQISWVILIMSITTHLWIQRFVLGRWKRQRI